jgi:hypothetical protein
MPPRLQKTLTLVLSLILAGFAAPVHAEAVEQKVRLSVMDPGDGSQCVVQAEFRGEHDNCKNDKAHGRSDCPKEEGCVCARKEKHVAWQIEGKDRFSIQFDQGSENPFVKDGTHECNFKSNKEGKLRCRLRGKNVPKGHYRYSILVPHCEPAVAEIKVY